MRAHVAKNLRHVVAEHLRHLHVQNEQIRTEPHQLLLELLERRGRAHFEAMRLEGVAQHVQNERAVVHDDDHLGGHDVMLLRRPTRRSIRWAGWTRA